jgi:hypothetical protein
MEMSDTMVIPFCSTLLLHEMMNLKITIFFFFLQAKLYWGPCCSKGKQEQTTDSFACSFLEGGKIKKVKMTI